MKKILIIGSKSFIGRNLKKYLSLFFEVDIYSFEKIIKRNLFFFDKYSHVINTSIHEKYIIQKYNKNYDLDKKFIKRFKTLNFFYIFLNSRKVYFPNDNIKEKSKPKPIDNYAINKLTTEKYLSSKIKKNLVSLRISNIIGKRINKSNRNNHKLFFDNFLNYRKKNVKLYVVDYYKDFISINQFCFIIRKIINKKIVGTYNVSLSQKVYVSEIVHWLDKDFYKKITFLRPQKKGSFTLSNTKLIKKLKIRITKNQLRLFCKRLIS